MKKTFRLVGLMFMAVVSFGLVACGSDDDDNGDDLIDTTPISVFAGKDKVIQGSDTISSLNKFVAYGSKNKVYGWHVGETTVWVNGKKSIPVKVLPTTNLYDDPICEWGCSMDYVKQNQKQGTINSKSSSTSLGYDNAGGATLLLYSFENGKLKNVVSVVSTNHTSTLADYLAERYLMLPLYMGKNMYFAGIDAVDEDHAKTLVYMDIYGTTDYWGILYAPFTKQSTRSNQYDEKKKVMELLLPYMTK